MQRLSRLWTVLIPVLILGAVLDRLGVAMAAPHSIYSAPAGQEMVFPTLARAMTLENLFYNAIFLQGIVGIPAGTNSPLWTLAYEFWFYMAFPFLMFALAPGRTPLQRLASTACLILIGLLVGWRIAFYFIFWLMGAAIELLPRPLSAPAAKRLATAGAVAFMGLLVAILAAKQSIFVSDTIQSLGFAAWCWVIVQMRDQRPRASLVVAMASGLSAISYTLYLVHAPVIAFISSIVHPAWQPWPLNVAGLLKFGLATSTVLAVAIAMWWLFERNTPVVRKTMADALARLRPRLASQ